MHRFNIRTFKGYIIPNIVLVFIKLRDFSHYFFRNKALKYLYISVAKSCKFPLWIVTDQSLKFLEGRNFILVSNYQYIETLRKYMHHILLTPRNFHANFKDCCMNGTLNSAYPIVLKISAYYLQNSKLWKSQIRDVDASTGYFSDIPLPSCT